MVIILTSTWWVIFAKEDCGSGTQIHDNPTELRIATHSEIPFGAELWKRNFA